jgi:hypothetical protein
MANKKIWLVMLALALTLAGCDDDSGGGGGSGYGSIEDLAGTWYGSVGYYNVTVVITNAGWTLTTSGNKYYDTGTYRQYGSGGYISIYSTMWSLDRGTARLVDYNTMILSLNSTFEAPGNYTLHRNN